MTATMPARTMRLSELFAGIVTAPDLEVSDITSHSGLVSSGALFIACRGAGGHGLEYAAAAVEAGAVAIAWEPEAGITAPEFAGIEVFAVDGLGAHVGELADRFFGQPSAALDVTGVTGTNGKTTTAWLAAGALDALVGNAAYMGTAGYGRVGMLKDSSLTTPGVIAVHRRMRELADAGAEHLVMEVSSHGLDQGRIDGVRMRVAGFSNLSRDHLDYHGTLAAYKEAKAKIFALPGVESAVINVGDAFGAELAERFAGEPGNELNIVRVALSEKLADGQGADLVADCSADHDGLLMQLSGRFGDARLHSSLWGRFNAENLLLAAGVLVAQGYDLQAVADALAPGALPPGRMQQIRGDDDAPVVVVDFAHTPDALAQVLATLREHCDGKIYCVFGCGGDRDAGKRAEMGEVATRLADHVVITSDNPRTEDPQAIIDAIASGAVNDAQYSVEPDRARAIGQAIDQAGRGDSVLVAGKGSEAVQIVGNEYLPFSDAAVAAQALGGAA